MFSSTIRRFDNSLCINADGFMCDESGKPIVGGTSGFSLVTPTIIAPAGSMRYDPVGKRLWIQETEPVGNTWQQLI